MKRGFLSQYFEGVAVKRLSSVEVNPSRSNQHELNGVTLLRKLLGSERLTNYPAHFVWLGGENEGVSADGRVTWYDARERHPTRTEYRLYFTMNVVMEMAEEGDLLFVAKRPDGELYMIVVKADSTLENQLLWLFGISEFDRNDLHRFSLQQIEDKNDLEVDFAVRYILEEIGIEVEEPDDGGLLDELLQPYFDTGFPTTAEFSAFSRRTVHDASPIEEPDNTLLLWMEQEERLFKRLERHLVSKRLEEGFRVHGTTDVEGFIQFSLSVQNRRKSRVGHALENHLEEIFKIHHVTYSRNCITENKSRPDFIFPGINCYHDNMFPEERLTMLGVKSTCKDRWRQVLAEAARIKTKHLFTLEPGISENQTNEMKANHLRLVLPQRLHETYKPCQQDWLVNLESFIRLVKDKQKSQV